MNDATPKPNEKRTFLVYNRKTGAIVCVHHMSAASGIQLPDNRVLEEQVLRTIGAGSASHELGVISYDGKAVDPTALHIDVATLRVISHDPDHRPN